LARSRQFFEVVSSQARSSSAVRRVMLLIMNDSLPGLKGDQKKIGLGERDLEAAPLTNRLPRVCSTGERHPMGDGGVSP
jgi:hypothetical protein